MRGGITTQISEATLQAMKQSQSTTYDDRGSLARSFDPSHPFGPTFDELKPYQYARHPQECYGPGKAIAGKGWKNLPTNPQTYKRGHAAGKTDWGTRAGATVQSDLDLRGGRDNPGEAGYIRGPVQHGPATARTPASMSALKPYNYGGPPRDYRNAMGFMTRAEAAKLPQYVRGKAAGRTDWGTRADAKVMSDIDLNGGRDNPGEAGYVRGAVQAGPATARTAASLAVLKPYSYGGPLRDFRNAMGFATRAEVRV